MPFDDYQISQPNQPVTNDSAQAPASANTPAAPASPSRTPTTPLGANDTQPQLSESGEQQVSNAGPVSPRGVQDPKMGKLVDASQHPLVQKAGVMHSVARALAGNPTRVVIDPDGTRRVVPVPMSGKQLGFAIALEALTGSLAGLAAGRGKGVGAAGMAGFQQGQKQVQERNDRQEQEAQQQFQDRGKALAQQASAYAANLRTRAMAQEVGMRDEQSHKDWIAAHAGTVQYFREHGGIIRDNVPESSLTPEFTRDALQKGWIAIPSGYVPRFDAQGNHYSPNGVAMHDNLYTIVDGSSIPLPADVLQKAQAWGLPGVTNRAGDPIHNLSDVELRVGTIADMTNKTAALDQEQKDLGEYYEYLNSKGVKGPNGKPLETPNLKQMVRQNPTLIQNITGPWANHFAESPSAALKAMKDDSPAKGLISNLYGGKQLLDKYDLLKDIEKKGAEETTAANVAIKKERDLIPIKAATAGAEAKAKAAVAATSARNEDGTWNMGSIPVQLVEGNMDPSQLSKRSADYNAKLEAASSYSLAKYGKPFDIAQASTDFKQANNPQVQSMLKMVGAMSAPNGELAIAVNAAKALPQLNSSLVNKVFNIAETQFGSDSVTNFHTAMIGFSDLYAKVMGGGVGTDALRQSAMDVLKDGYSRGQLAGAIKVLEQQIEARKSQMIGANPYLRKQFGGPMQPEKNATPPPGATMQVPGSDGQMHWSDGKRDLGLVK